jgi:predicted dehydrogenase
VRRVSAFMTDRRHGTAYHNISAALEFEQGGTGTILISLDSSRLHPIEFAEVCGTAGHAHVHNVVAGFDFFPHDSDLASSWRPQPFGGRQHLLQFYPTTIEAHVEELLAALEEKRAPPVTGEDGLRALRIVLSAIRSFETGAAVEPAAITADSDSRIARMDR